MATSTIKKQNVIPSIPFKWYTNATMAQIVSDAINNEFAFVINESVEQGNRPDGITSSFYFAIIPKADYISSSAFGIVWSNVDQPHVVSFYM